MQHVAAVTGFLIEAIHRGHTGRHVPFPKLVGELYASVADHSEETVIKRVPSETVQNLGFPSRFWRIAAAEAGSLRLSAIASAGNAHADAHRLMSRVSGAHR